MKFGIHSKSPVLPGEDEGAYREIQSEYLALFAPKGPVENTIVRQIIAEAWRLERIQKAEKVLYGRVIEGQIARLLGSFNAAEKAYVSSSYAEELNDEISHAHRAQETECEIFERQHHFVGPSRPPARSDDEIQDGVEDSLSRILAPENILRDSLIPSTERAPQSYLDNERRVAARAYLAYVNQLKIFQKDRLTVTKPQIQRLADISDLA